MKVTQSKYDRQSFLGANSQQLISNCKIGIVGLGGGGSHISQQLAHIGFRNYVLYDPDTVEDTNLNRLVGAQVSDVADDTPKVVVSKRVIAGLQPDALIKGIQQSWQENPIPLKTCDIIFGCLDGYKGRMELENFCRRWLIPYIDIGIDVHKVGNEAPHISGQVIASLPGHPCMRCFGFITEEKLQREAERYGAAGHNPQVIWANGIVASSAVGIAVNIITGFAKSLPHLYLSYDGNFGTITPHVRIKYAESKCDHFPPDQVGEVVFKEL
jgi:molybdopterin-synthase adenylyltransferase